MGIEGIPNSENPVSSRIEEIIEEKGVENSFVPVMLFLMSQPNDSLELTIADRLNELGLTPAYGKLTEKFKDPVRAAQKVIDGIKAYNLKHGITDERYT